MTIQSNSTFYKSETMVYNSSTGQYVPKWQIEDRSTAYRRTFYIYYYSAPKSIERVINVNVNFHYGQIHLTYLIDSNPDRLYEVLNNGSIYAYLAKIDRMAARTIMKQIEDWKATEEDYIRAKKEADYASELGLLSNMTSRAEEMVYSSILCA